MNLDVLDRLTPVDLFSAALKSYPSPRQLLSQARHLNPKHQIHYFNWGRNALFWLIKAANWPKVAVPDFTCPVVVEAIQAAGAQPVFLKTNPQTLLLDQTKLKAAPALIAVHTHGLVEDIKALKTALPNTHIIEDCATALFSKIRTYVGRQGDSALFSLYKQTNGLNGALLTTSLKIDRYRQPEPLISHWKRFIFRTAGPWQWYFDQIRRRQKQQLRRFRFAADKAPPTLAQNLFSLNFKAAQAASQNQPRLASLYHQRAQAISGISLIRPRPHTTPHLYRYPLLVKKNRDQVLLKLRSQKIFADALWYDAYGNSRIASQILTLPIKPEYTQTEVDRLFTALEQAILESA